ncbi:MAG: acyl-CoA dehydrogenase [Pseudomonadota bacterium]|nr:acyl-CoA dehydrogenase [Pseudomonadota bacterium]
MTSLILAIIAIVGVGLVAYFELGLVAAAIVLAVVGALELFGVFGAEATLCSWVWFVLAAPFALLAITPLRRALVTSTIFKIYKKITPKMSDTEKTALDAGTVSWDGEVFSGKPNWDKLMEIPNSKSLSEKEQAFLDGPVNEACQIADNEWEVAHQRADLSPEAWKFLGDNKFFGLIIPDDEGGNKMSARAQTAILQRLSTHTILNVTVGVPNSLGPGELIHNYGTKEQKEYYLPRLADGREIPCFALTGPRAGSDATSLPDNGVICKGKHPVTGEEVLGFNANFEKRYITLSPVATVVGLAIHLFDPEKLLGDDYDLGITCALLPRTTEGLSIGTRHYPIGAPFMNGPLRGKDVFIPLDWIIGGQDMIGHGWRMLVECLSVGRCITLPSGAAGSSRYALAASGAYARVRRQFNVPVAEMEGVQEALARIAGNHYLCDAGVSVTAGLIDQGHKPSVPSAILKYHLTEAARDVANDAMDIHGGKGICQGPKNYLSFGYSSVPVAITVEGANILTRCLMIFGQGAMRCHPYVLAELNAGQEDNLAKFDKALFGHFGFIFRNTARSFVGQLTKGLFTSSPFSGTSAKYGRFVNRYSSTLALMTDACMLSMGGELKFRELISGRLGDILSNLYLMTMVLKRYEDGNKVKGEEALLDYTCAVLACRVETAVDEVLKNMPNRLLARVVRVFAMPCGKTAQMPGDKLVRELATAVSTESDLRTELLKGAALAGTEDDNMILQYNALIRDAAKAKPIYQKVGRAFKKGEIDAINLHIEDQITAANKAGIISQEDADFMLAFEKKVLDIVNVDEHPFDSLAKDPSLVHYNQAQDDKNFLDHQKEAFSG